MDVKEIASGLQFPEGPVAMADGSVILVEIAAGAITRVRPDGTKETVAKPGGGPNGAALGPGGMLYVCNNGGLAWTRREDGRLIPAHSAEDHAGGRIERVDLASGRVEVLYESCGGVRLSAPNDLVFDTHGGFWFTDHGATVGRMRVRGAVYYARADGSHIEEASFPLEGPNGIGLSPDGGELYVAETVPCRLWAYPVTAPGKLGRRRFVANPGGLQYFDSLAVDAAGNVCVATILNGGVTSMSPDGGRIEHFPAPDRLTTNICFGGADLRTAFLTLSGTGKLVSMTWPRPGLRLNYADG
jgi:gluconolactonase